MINPQIIINRTKNKNETIKELHYLSKNNKILTIITIVNIYN
jgi:hypothetical protein